MDDDLTVQMNKRFDQHQSDFHGNLEAGEGSRLIEEHVQMVNDTAANKKMLKRMVVAIEGEPIVNMSGQIIGYEGGLVNKVDEINTPTFVPSRAQKITLWVGGLSVFTALFYLVIAVINATDQGMGP
jgi:hypothetical protein